MSQAKTADVDSAVSVVRPVAVTEKSYLDGALGLIRDVMPSSLSSPEDRLGGMGSVGDAVAVRNHNVLWSTFDMSTGSPLLLLGYETGLQVWDLGHPHGMATELFSLRGVGPVACAVIVPEPRTTATASTHHATATTATTATASSCSAAAHQQHKEEDDGFPLLAYALQQKSRATRQQGIVTLISLRTGAPPAKLPAKLKVAGPPLQICASGDALAVAYATGIAVFAAGTLECRGNVVDILPPYLCPPGAVSMALGTRWMAYNCAPPGLLQENSSSSSSSSNRNRIDIAARGVLVEDSSSGGGGGTTNVGGSGADSGNSGRVIGRAVGIEAATGGLASEPRLLDLHGAVDLAQRTKSRLVALGGRGAQAVANIINGVQDAGGSEFLVEAGGGGGSGGGSSSAEGDVPADLKSYPPAMVRVVDCGAASNQCGDEGGGAARQDSSPAALPLQTVAYFRAHHDGMAHIVFDRSGTLVATAGATGQRIHVFSLVDRSGLMAASASTKGLLVARHLCTLERGLTTTRIVDLAFSPDARWLAASSSHGTTHVFPVALDARIPSPRTHASPLVVNTSRFHRSSGVNELRCWHERPPAVVHGALSRIHCAKEIETQGGTIVGGGGGGGKTSFSNSGVPLSVGANTKPAMPLSAIFEPWQQCGLGVAADPGISLVVAGPAGHMIEHHLLAHDMSSHESCALARRKVLAGGGALVGDGMVAEVASTISSIVVDGVSKVIAMGGAAGASVVGASAGLSGGNKGKGPSSSGSATAITTSSATSASDALGLVCAAKRRWHFSRPQQVSRAQAALPPLRVPFVPIPVPALARAPAVAGAAPHDKWLSEIEITTYAAPHRRIWMGPQFGFNTLHSTTPAAASGKEQGQAVAPAGAAGVSMGLYARTHSLKARPLTTVQGSPLLMDSTAEGRGAFEDDRGNASASGAMESRGVLSPMVANEVLVGSPWPAMPSLLPRHSHGGVRTEIAQAMTTSMTDAVEAHALDSSSTTGKFAPAAALTRSHSSISTTSSTIFELEGLEMRSNGAGEGSSHTDLVSSTVAGPEVISQLVDEAVGITPTGSATDKEAWDEWDSDIGISSKPASAGRSGGSLSPGHDE